MRLVASNLMPTRQFERPGDRIAMARRAVMLSVPARRAKLPTPRPALDARFRDPWGVTGVGDACGALSAGCEQLAVHSRKGLRGAIVGAQAGDQAPPVLDESPGTVDEFLHHRLQPSALGLVAHRRIRPVQPGLTQYCSFR